jgi:hypothetical protein
VKVKAGHYLAGVSGPAPKVAELRQLSYQDLVRCDVVAQIQLRTAN